jgi:signal transduction histidine kinase
VRRLLPNTLISQVALILLTGLVVSHLVAGWVYRSDRVKAVRAIGGYAAAQRIANLARLLDEAPADWRDRIIAVTAGPTLRIALSPRAPAWITDQPEQPDPPIGAYLREQLPASLAETVEVSVFRPPPSGPGAQAMNRPVNPPMMRPWHDPPAGAWRRLRVGLRLSDGQWLSVTLGLPDPAPPTPWQFPIALGVMAAIVVPTSIWAVRRVTAPLGTVTRAAERLGRDVNAPPIPETGSLEMRQAAHAFNEMQSRLQRLLHNRTTMLAALSHDLRTPLTLVRLRTEALPEGEERDRLLASIDTLEAMVSATLRYARDTTEPEAWRRTDLAALLGVIVDDMADAGLPVTMAPAAPIVVDCQPQGLRRAVTNLLDNGVKYGVRARLSLQQADRTLRIVIDDDGPGIPAEDLPRVFEPFHRLEPSRSRDTGGSGLGLAIAQAIAEAHDGRITLSNRPEGGLRATLTMPIERA